MFVLPEMDYEYLALTVMTNKGGYTETGQITRETQYLGVSPISAIIQKDKKEFEPRSVEQVFVGQKLSTLNNNELRLSNQMKLKEEANDGDDNELMGTSYFAFKTCRGGYLSFSAGGEASVETLAIGPSETWEPVLRVKDEGPGSLALMGHADATGSSTSKVFSAKRPHEVVAGIEAERAFPSSSRFLSFSPRGNTPGTAHPAKIKLHTAPNTVGFGEVFKAYCQAKVKYDRIRMKMPKADDTRIRSLANDELEST
ncbi:hypothetical protein AYI70_g11626 [Smittium culicis]|uniref:Uncharacterized protein n=1 Tax=Smittium culicis TaxID=133412 RepID=A0A1R1X0Z0_9FUNG|nr:hypothetical protein AYI70_g11626 [Smittium culicis]